MTAPSPLPGLVAQLDGWLQALEGEHFEFKEAVNQFSFRELAQYCCALSNEGGGRVILGVTNKRPRQVVGTRAFPQIEETRKALMDALRIGIGVTEVAHPGGRVLVFEVAGRPIGMPISHDGRWLAREADSLVALSADRLRAIFAEAGRDFSADPCPGASPADLDVQAIEEFRRRWILKSQNQTLAGLSHEQLLRDAELIVDGGLTWAAVVLFATRPLLGRLLPQAEVVFEYRSTEAAGPAQARAEYRQGFFAFYEDLWNTINLRNDVQHYQDGLFVLDVPTFDERTVREAVLNAVCHRDYQLGGSIFVRQYPRRLVIESPGGLPVGITPDNILDKQSPRNRRIATAFALCGLVERSGQGMNLIFERTISSGKSRPDFAGTDQYEVRLTIPGEVTDPRFVRAVQNIAGQFGAPLDTHAFLVLDLVHRGQSIPPPLQAQLAQLEEFGAVERVGRGRGARVMLSRRFYEMVGARATYTRRRGLDDETNKALLLQHLRRSRDGCQLGELQQVVPALSRATLRRLLAELRREDKAILRDPEKRRWARWFAAQDQ